MKKLTLITLILFIGLTANSWATSYVGSIVGGSTLIAISPWNTTSTSLSWTVDDDSNPGYWTYSYTFAVPSKAISHVIIEVSDNFTSNNIHKIFDSPEGPKTNTQQQGNPNMPGDMYGIKWNTTGDPLSYSFWIVTDRAPMWGDFYAKDGSIPHTEDFVYAYNSSFGQASTSPIGNGNAGGWALVPDTGTGVIPEPGTFLLLGTGLLGIAALRYRRAKK